MTRVKHGKQIRPRIGKVGVIKLREAREKAKQIIAQADDGVDPLGLHLDMPFMVDHIVHCRRLKCLI